MNVTVIFNFSRGFNFPLAGCRAKFAMDGKRKSIDL
jgi:hypothetical protein